LSSQIVDVAEAVVTSLNTAFSADFTATRKWIPKVDLDDLGTLTVTVAPRDYARANDTKGSVRRTIQIDIGIQKRLGTTTNPEDPTKLSEIDELMELAEDIADHLNTATHGRYGGAAHVLSEIPEPMYDRSIMDEHHVFQSVVTATFTRT
jgi:hypothetical protein